ncbi:MAG: AI-2E family transporter [Pseudonocardiaceae bacterium]
MSESSRRDASTAVPYPLRVAAAVSWRVLAVAGLFVVVGYLVIWLRVVVIPVAVALLLTALLGPVVNWMTRRVPRALATTIVMFSGLALIGGLLAFVIQAFVDGFPELWTQVAEAIREIRIWLEQPHFGLPPVPTENLFNSLSGSISSSSITSGALTTAVTVGEILTGMVLTLFVLIYFLYGGRSMWLFLVRLTPEPVQRRVDFAGLRAYDSLVGFVRATVLVAVADAIGIGIGLLVVGAPLVVPLTALVFLASFVPVVGAVISGVVAVLVVLVANGPVEALIVLGVVIGVQQLEGNVLQPLLLGRAVALNGVAVVLAVAVGALTAGITGTLLAVPLLAVLNAGIRALAKGEEAEEAPPKHQKGASVVPLADTAVDPDPDPLLGADVPRADR